MGLCVAIVCICSNHSREYNVVMRVVVNHWQDGNTDLTFEGWDGKLEINHVTSFDSSRNLHSKIRIEESNSN